MSKCMCTCTDTQNNLWMLDWLLKRKCFPLYREFFGQGWMKPGKNERTPYIMRTTKHFNDVCENRWLDGRMDRQIDYAAISCFSDQQQDCYRDPTLGWHQHAGGSDWEVGGRGWYLPLPPQLQRSAWDHVFSQPQLSLPTQKNMAQSFQAGVGPLTVNIFHLLRCPWETLASRDSEVAAPILLLFSRQKLWSIRYRSWCHQRGDSKIWEKLWRSELHGSPMSHLVSVIVPVRCHLSLYALSSAVTPPVFPIWECTWLTWPS